MIITVLLNCIWKQHQGMIATFFLASALPATFYLALCPIKKINLERISCVLDPRLWLPFSYVVYFVALPCITIFLDSKYSICNAIIPQIMLSTLLGIVSLQLGLHIIEPIPESIQNKIWLDRYSAIFLFLFSLILYLYYWLWRIQNGFFFTHAAAYIPILNILNGIRDTLGRAVKYVPLYILVVAYRNELWKKRKTLYFFVIYACSTGILFLAAGQIRDIFFFSLMILASSAYLAQIKKIRWFRTGLVILIILVSCIFLIYSLRYSAIQIYQGGNQFKFILLNFPSIVREGREIAKTSRGIKNLALDRIYMTQNFFNQTIRALNENTAYGYGNYTITTLPIIIPRLLWLRKGIIIDTEQIIQQNVLRTIPHDMSLTPLTQFYAEGNIVGILIGFFMLGLVSSYAHKACFSFKNGIGGLVCWVVILGSIIQFENNIPIALLLGIRNGLIFMVFTFIFSIFNRKKIIMNY